MFSLPKICVRLENEFHGFPVGTVDGRYGVLLQGRETPACEHNKISYLTTILMYLFNASIEPTIKRLVLLYLIIVLRLKIRRVKVKND